MLMNTDNFSFPRNSAFIDFIVGLPGGVFKLSTLDKKYT